MLEGAKLEAAYLLATSDETQAEIAERVGVTSRTLRHWLEDAEFRGEIQTVTRRFLLAMAGVAAARIRRILRDGRDRDAVPALRIYLTAIGLLRDDPVAGATGSVGPVILPADSPEWQAYRDASVTDDAPSDGD